MNKRRGASCFAFCSALKEKLRDRASNFEKENLKLLADEIRVDKKELRLSGSYAALSGTLRMSTKPGQFAGLPRFVPAWLSVVNELRTFDSFSDEGGICYGE